MPKNGDAKRLVRERMAKTGESYSIARMRLVGPEGASAVGPSNGSTRIAGRAEDDLKKARPATVAARYHLMIKLVGIEPAIWRMVEVPALITLAAVHRVLQAVMGWKDYHLHRFLVGDTNYGVPNPEYEDGLPMNDERMTTLAQIAAATSRLVYEYDFGDGWEHEILIEASPQSASAAHNALCLDGARACPPEDCGGTSGYERMLRILADPDDQEHREMKVWVGRRYDPEEFDLERTKQAVAKVKLAARRGLSLRPDQRISWRGDSMRDLSDICLNIDACAQRAQKNDQGGLEQELRNVIRDIGAVSKDLASPFIAAGGHAPLSAAAPRSQIIEKMKACAARAQANDQGGIAAEILHAAQDLQEWYGLS